MKDIVSKIYSVQEELGPAPSFLAVRVDPSEGTSFHGVEISLMHHQCVLDYVLQLIPTRGLFPPLQVCVFVLEKSVSDVTG